MEKKQGNTFFIRLIPASVLIATVVILAFRFTESYDRGASFIFFLALMLYAVTMIFFSDLIFLRTGRTLRFSYPIIYIACIHAAYAGLILILRVILSFLPDIYFILTALIITSIQIAVSLYIFKGVDKIKQTTAAIKQDTTTRAEREALLSALTFNINSVQALSSNFDMKRRLEVFSNALRFSPDQDLGDDMAALTGEINISIKVLSDTIASGMTDPDEIISHFTKITAQIEQRKSMHKIYMSK